MDLEITRVRFDTKWKLDEQTGCWLWTASCAGKGYGQIKIPGTRRQIYAHRLSYILHKGKVGRGKHVCHTCDNPKCVNPEHLFVGTSKDNHQDMKRKGRHLFGSKNNQSRLTEKDVSHIHALLKLGMAQTKIAQLYKVHQVSISKINCGMRWTHLKPD